MHPKVKRLTVICAGELDRLDADWAIGGAVAMAAHGFERATMDIDLFIGDDVREEFLARLEQRGLDAEPLFEPSHYSLVPDRAVEDVRVDLLFPASAPETLAIMAARRENVAGKELPVWPLEHIAAAKFMTDPHIDPVRARKDAADLEELRVRGMLDVARIERVLDDCRDAAARERLFDLVGRHRRRR